MNELIKVDISKPEIPEKWNYEQENKKFDEVIFGWRRLTIDVISTLWIFYNKLVKPGSRTNLSQNREGLPTWKEWLLSKGIGKNTPTNHFKKLGWIEGEPRVVQNTGENEWHTPENIIKSVRNVMGNINLDPASSELANQTIKANHYYTEIDNGLEQKWHGSIWLNPPYSQPLISEFSKAVINKRDEYTQACVLVNNATETPWFQPLLKRCDICCFFKSRVKFVDKEGVPSSGLPLQGQVLLYFGENIDLFYQEFKEFGVCVSVINQVE